MKKLKIIARRNGRLVGQTTYTPNPTEDRFGGVQMAVTRLCVEHPALLDAGAHVTFEVKAEAPALAQRLLNIGDQIFDILDADREAHQAVREADLFTQVLVDGGVGHDRRMLDE